MIVSCIVLVLEEEVGMLLAISCWYDHDTVVKSPAQVRACVLYRHRDNLKYC